MFCFFMVNSKVRHWYLQPYIYNIPNNLRVFHNCHSPSKVRIMARLINYNMYVSAAVFISSPKLQLMPPLLPSTYPLFILLYIILTRPSCVYFALIFFPHLHIASLVCIYMTVFDIVGTWYPRLLTRAVDRLIVLLVN